jgi:hypothetical protein
VHLCIGMEYGFHVFLATHEPSRSKLR